MNKKIMLFILSVVCLMSVCNCFAQSSESTELIDNGDGTYSVENGIFLRHYDGYSEESQVYLSALDACYSIVADYSPLIDTYINGDKSFESEQWSTIFSEIKFMSGKACSYVMHTETPDDLSEHSYEIFYSAYHLMIGNDLLIDAITKNDVNEAATASYYFALADNTLGWWNDKAEK